MRMTINTEFQFREHFKLLCKQSFQKGEFNVAEAHCFIKNVANEI